MLDVDLKRFERSGRLLLESIAFRLEAGASLTIMGANGAGKSTLAKVLCGLYPTQGAVRIAGERLEKLPAQRRAKLLYYLPSKLEVYDPYLTVESYLSLCGTRLHAQRGLESFGLTHLRRHPLGRLSSGEGQIVMLACAAIHDAAITLYDEPTANLDPGRASEVFAYLKKRDAQQIVITHDFQLAYRLGYPILYLHAGRMEAPPVSAERFFSESALRRRFGGHVVKVGDIVAVRL